MKKVFLFVVVSLSFIFSHAQFVFGKSYETAKKDLISSLLKSGFHFLKQEIAGSQPGGGYVYMLRFKEEFKVVVWVNDYENVKRMTFESKRQDVYKKLKKFYQDNNWVRNGSNDNGAEYSYKGLVITEFPYQWYTGSNGDVYKLMITASDF